MLETILLILLSIILVASLVSNIYLFSRYKRFLGVIAQLIVDKEILVDKVDELVAMSSKEFNDGFIKFISESRESAFQYIEEVQVSIKNYLNAINLGTQDDVVAARMELFNHLPEENEE